MIMAPSAPPRYIIQLYVSLVLYMLFGLFRTNAATIYIVTGFHLRHDIISKY